MAIPKVNDLYNPILEYFYNKKEMVKYINNDELMNYLIYKLKCTEEEIKSKTRVGWGITFLCKAGLLYRPERGFVEITEEGKKLIDDKVKINTKYLKDNYPEFRLFQTTTKNDDDNVPTNNDKEEEMEEVTNELYSKVDDYYEFIENSILEKLFEIVQNDTTKAKGDTLENVSVKLFDKMGYFNVRKTGGTNDGGIDGDFAIDKFGLERIAFQCKFFNKENSVSSKDIDAFSGSLNKLGYQKGVFVTTSKFPTKTDGHKNITFIDGKKLAKLMREHEILCNVVNTYKYYSLNDNIED